MPRHRKYQIIISLGVVVTAVAPLWAPGLEHVFLVGSVATNLLWIWE